MDTTPSAEAFWDREAVDPTHTTWMEHPLIHDYILRSISAEGLWSPIDWFAATVAGRRFARALSIGCGTGPLERDLVRRGLVDRIDAFDGSTNSLRVARRLAAAEGFLPRIGYFAADFNQPAFRAGAYDAVFIHQALHHVYRLERLLPEVMKALKPDGILYLDEYIGPSRTAWRDRLIRPHRAAFSALPEGVRRTPALLYPIQPDDPSEGIRSGEIVPRVSIGFHVEAMRGYGGNLLSVIYPSADFSREPEAVEALIAAEKALLASGAPPYYALIVARPKQGRAARRAHGAYALLDAVLPLQTAYWAADAAVRLFFAKVRYHLPFRKP